VKDANGLVLATCRGRADLRPGRYDVYLTTLTLDEARRIAKGIARLPEFMMRAPGFEPNTGADFRWNPAKPYHVALSFDYVRANKSMISALCNFNNIPFDPTGQRIDDDGEWCVYEFARQQDALLFWDRFSGRWLRRGKFFYPDRPKRMPRWREPKPRDLR
jgi:hypothetical protein